MTPQTTPQSVILIGLIVFIALEFLLIAYGLWLWKQRKPEPPARASHADGPQPEIAFRWPDRIELQYTDASGEVIMANRFYIPE